MRTMLRQWRALALISVFLLLAGSLSLRAQREEDPPGGGGGDRPTLDLTTSVGCGATARVPAGGKLGILVEFRGRWEPVAELVFSDKRVVSPGVVEERIFHRERVRTDRAWRSEADIGPQLGPRALVVRAFVNGRFVAEDECSFTVVSASRPRYCLAAYSLTSVPFQLRSPAGRLEQPRVLDGQLILGIEAPTGVSRLFSLLLTVASVSLAARSSGDLAFMLPAEEMGPYTGTFDSGSGEVGIQFPLELSHALIDEAAGVQVFEDYTLNFREVYSASLSGIISPGDGSFQGSLQFQLRRPILGFFSVGQTRFLLKPVFLNCQDGFPGDLLKLSNNKRRICLRPIIVKGKDGKDPFTPEEVAEAIRQANDMWCRQCCVEIWVGKDVKGAKPADQIGAADIEVKTAQEAAGIEDTTKKGAQSGEQKLPAFFVEDGPDLLGNAGCENKATSATRTVVKIGRDVLEDKDGKPAGCAKTLKEKLKDKYDRDPLTFGRVLAHELGHALCLPQGKLNGKNEAKTREGNLMNDCAEGRKLNKTQCNKAYNIARVFIGAKECDPKPEEK